MESYKQKFEHLKIPLKEILSATKSFDKTKVIGEGGFGKVYIGELSNSKVAIKRLDRRRGQGDREFWKEITILTGHTHENIISLLGFCDQGDEKILVYEYASNLSLDVHLSSTDFTWTRRLKTCLGVARGISYLDSKEIVHRDIKSSNVLLDANWNAKLSDMGLSKTISDRGHITEIAGTPVYCEPQYQQMGFLTKGVDVYPFGLLLLEVLCGKLCYNYIDGKTYPIVSEWIKSYKEKKLQDIIFDDLKQQKDPSSLKKISEIAFKCLMEPSRRPTMTDVVKELEDALKYQELYDNVKLPEDYKEMLMITEEHPLNNMPETELKMLLLEGILCNGGKTWFSLNMDGEQCEMISIAECLTSNTSDSRRCIPYPAYNSRFAAGCYEPFGEKFTALVITQLLSPQITYSVNLVFKRKKSANRYIGLEYKLDGEKEKSYSFVSDQREDGWLTAELYQITSRQRTVKLEILFYPKYCKDLLVEGIEFRPLGKAKHENVAIQPKKDLSEELLIKHFGEERFTFTRDGKKCLMLPALAVLDETEWNWNSLPDTRFGEVADCNVSDKLFVIFCKFSSQMLSPQTTYATYLVYKLSPKYNDLNPPVQIVDENSDSKEENNIFLLTPQTPVISLNNTKKTFNTSSRPKIKGLPKKRSNDWMEVQVHEFQTRATIRMISMHLRLSSKDNALKGITVQGLEFRPI